MKHMKTVSVPASSAVVLDHVTCDFCGERTGAHGYNLDEVEIRHKHGTDYPDGGSGTESVVDMCGKCFESRLVPWLQSQGVTPRSEQWEW